MYMQWCRKMFYSREASNSGVSIYSNIGGSGGIPPWKFQIFSYQFWYNLRTKRLPKINLLDDEKLSVDFEKEWLIWITLLRNLGA